MTDPLSFVASVSGLVSLGITVSQGLSAYYSQFKGFEGETIAFVKKIRGLENTLERLNGLLQEFQSAPDPLPASDIQLVADRVSDCGEELKRLEQALEKCRGCDLASTLKNDSKSKLVRKTLYPFRRATILDLENTILSLQSNLDTALGVFGLSLERRTQQQLTLSLSASQATLANTRDLSNSLHQLRQTQQAQGDLFHEQYKIMQEILLLQQHHHAMITQGAANAYANSPLLNPATLQSLCDRQTAIETATHQQSFAVNHPGEYRRQRRCTCPSSNMMSFWHRNSGRNSCAIHSSQEIITLCDKRYAFCNRFLRFAVRLNINMIKGAGGFAISPVLVFQNIVPENSPAFQLLKTKISQVWTDRDSNFPNLVKDTLRQLDILFAERKASPQDILPTGDSILHKILELFHYHYVLNDYEELFSSLRKYLYSYNFPMNIEGSQGTVLDRLTSLGFHEGGQFHTECAKIASTLLSQGAISTHLILKEAAIYYDRGFVSIPIWDTNKLMPLLIKQDTIEDYPLSELQAAILERSESKLKWFLTHHPSLCEYEQDLPLAVCWPQGLRMIVDNIPVPPIQLIYVLYAAIYEHSLESVEIALVHNCPIASETLRVATKYFDRNIFRVIVSTLVERRQRLQKLAEDCLPLDIVNGLDLKQDAVLDYQANAVQDLLLKHQISVSPELQITHSPCSVFENIFFNTEAAEILYDAGFSILARPSKMGGQSVFRFPTIESWQWRECFDFCQWTRSKLVRLGLGNLVMDSLPLYYLAFVIQFSIFPKIRRKGNDRKMGRRALCELYKHISLLEMVLLDETHYDTCTCACSTDGCLPSIICFKEYMKFSNFISPDHLMAQLIRFLDETFDPADIPKHRDRLAPVIIRLCVFSKLQLTHTCCSFDSFWRRKQFDIQNAMEIQSEEMESIDQLEVLVAELILKYREMDVSLPDFLEGYYRTRMDDALSQSTAPNPEETEKIKELGVILDPM